ncbi:hypothetical protein IX49_03025 [Cellulophaga lytica]|nr:hypothetical protein IX49_03025 [Cellulophaga lytica]
MVHLLLQKCNITLQQHNCNLLKILKNNKKSPKINIFGLFLSKNAFFCQKPTFFTDSMSPLFCFKKISI